MKNYKINIIFYNTSTHFIVLYPNRTQRHLKNPYKAHKCEGLVRMFLRFRFCGIVCYVLYRFSFPQNDL